jgi:hypothetical protein
LWNSGTEQGNELSASLTNKSRESAERRKKLEEALNSYDQPSTSLRMNLPNCKTGQFVELIYHKIAWVRMSPPFNASFEGYEWTLMEGSARWAVIGWLAN